LASWLSVAEASKQINSRVLFYATMPQTKKNAYKVLIINKLVKNSLWQICGILWHLWHCGKSATKMPQK
jgi:hypothetical protein